MISDRMFQTSGNSVIFNFLFCWIGFFYLDVCTKFLKLKHSFLILLQSTNIGIHIDFCIYIFLNLFKVL